LFATVNIKCSTSDDLSLVLEPWSYDGSPGTELVQHLTTNLCFQANGVSLLKAGHKRFEFSGAHVSLNRAGDSQTFTVGNSIVRGISIDIPTAWLKKFCLDDVVTGEGLGIRDPDLVFLARRIYEESLCGDVFSPMVIDALMVELLVNSVRRLSASKRVAPGWVQQIASAIRNDPSHPYKLEELSNLVGYHPVHIARTFREFTGKTVGEFVRCARLELAKTLLADNRLSIAEIAQMAGFTDQSHLNRLFRRCFNLTPQAVRRMQNS
jgi:AraC-like DNA-binding protein